MEGGDGLSVLANCVVKPIDNLRCSHRICFSRICSAALQEGAYDTVKPCDIDNKCTIRRGVEHRRLMLAEQKARTDLEQ